MIVNAKNVTHLPHFEYSQLAESVRPVARQAVLDEEIKAVNRSISELRELSRTNIHSVIGNRYNNVQNILRRKRHIHNLSTDLTRLEGTIDDNYCQFLEDGSYILWNFRQ